MAKGGRGDNRGGARGRGGASPAGATRGGADHGATAGRGRGAGGVSSSRRLQSREDMSELSFDYSSLTEDALGYNLSPSFPVPKLPTWKPYPPPTPPNGGNSGYNTPKRGVGSSGRGGGPSRGGSHHHHQNPTSSFRGREGAGGLGFHDPITASTGFRPSTRGRGGIVGFTPGGHRPLLVPVTFVAASGLTPKMQGDLDVDEVPGELDEKVVQGTLVESVREFGHGDESSPEDDESTSESDEHQDVEAEVTQQTVVKEEETMLVVEDEASGVEDMEAAPTFVMDSTPSRVEEALVEHNTPPSPLVVPSNFVLGVSSNTTPSRDEDASDSDDDEGEQIVFDPTASTSSNPPPRPPSAPRAAREVVAPTIAKEFAAAAPTAQLNRTKKGPAPKLTKAQKRAGKKARRAGRLHARSGNQHLFVEVEGSDEEDQAVDEEDARQGREMFARLELNDDVDGMQVEEGGEDEVDDDDGEEVPKPRVGDSDLEWGSNGPPKKEVRSTFAGIGSKAKKESQKRHRREQTELEKMQRLASGARSHVERLLGGNRAMDDYARNLLGENEDGEIDLEAARKFAEGLMGSSSGVQKTLDDLVDEARSEQEDGQDGWRTTNGSEEEDEDEDEDESESENEESSSGSSGSEEFDSNDELERDHTLGNADAAVDRAMADAEEAMMDDASSHLDSSVSSDVENDAIEAALLAGQTIRLSSVDVSGPGGRRDRKERKRAKKGKGRWVESDSSDEDEEVRMFTGEHTWADNDEDFIQELQDILDTNESLLLGSGRKNRKKLFKAVQNGNFDDIDLSLDDDVLLASGPSRKSKASKPTWDGEFADELQAQWENDRAKKSDFKRKRALARAEAKEAAPHKFKKGHVPPTSFAGSSDVAVINLKMREFILHDLEQGSLSLPPMSKKSRVAVHLLSEAYGLNSKSVGKGKARFPVLVRTQKTTTYGVDERKIRAIISTAEGERMPGGALYGGRAKGKQGGLWAALSGDGKKSSGGGGGGGGMGGKRHDEGAVVGQGADRLGEDNIGFALLKRMGWTEGMQIGKTGGISEPIAARIKTNKSGLGSGYSVSRLEAQIMAAGPSQ